MPVLHMVCLREDARIGEDLLNDCYKANPRALDQLADCSSSHKYMGSTPLHAASNLWKAKFLIEKGANINSVN